MEVNQTVKRNFTTLTPSRWIFWTQLIFGGFAQLLHWSIPETSTLLLIYGRNLFQQEQLSYLTEKQRGGAKKQPRKEKS